MRAFASLLAISLALLATTAAASPPPRRVASLNLCTDELILALADRRQIVSVTHLAQDPAESPFWRQARRYRRNDGSLIGVAPMRADLVVTMGGAGDRVGIARRIGLRMLELPYPTSLADFEANIVRVATALGRPQAAAPWLARIQALRRSARPPGIDAIWLGEGGRTMAPASLEAQWMRLAGLSQRRLRGDRVPLETLIARPPDVLLRVDYRQGQYSSGRRWLGHPLAQRTRARRTIVSDGRNWTCMGLLMIAETERLRRIVQ